MLFSPLLKLLWCWSISGCLKLLNLVSIKAIVVKNLPLFRLSLISLDFALRDLRSSNDLLDPILHFDEHLLESGVVFEACGSSVLPHELHLVVIVVVVVLARGKVFSNELHLGLLVFEAFP